MSSSRTEDLVEGADTLRRNRPPKPPIRQNGPRHVLLHDYEAALVRRIAGQHLDDVMARAACRPRPDAQARAMSEAILKHVRSMNSDAEQVIAEEGARRQAISDALALAANGAVTAPDPVNARALRALRATPAPAPTIKAHVLVARPTPPGKPGSRPHAR